MVTRLRIDSRVLLASLALAALHGLRAPQRVAAQTEAPTARSLPNSVRLQLNPCNSAKYDPSELAELLRVELRELGVEQLDVEPIGPSAEPPSTAALALVHLGCGTVRATLAIELADLVAGNRVSREIVVDDVPPNRRARALSIAIASLIESSWSLLAASPVEAAADSGPTPMPESVRAALRRRLSANLAPPAAAAAPPAAATDTELPPVLQAKHATATPAPLLALRGSLVGRAFPTSATGLTGLDIAAVSRISPTLELAFDLEALYERRALRDLGGPDADLETLWLSAGASVYVALPAEPRFLLGPTLRVAHVNVDASTRDDRLTAQDGNGWIAMFGLSSLLEFALSRTWALLLGADIAYVPGGLSFRTDETRAISFADLALALRLGVAWNQ